MTMTVVHLEDVVLLGAVSLIHVWQCGMAATEVVRCREKYNVKAPEMNGPPEFMRAVRAQQNSLEFGVLFEIILWLAGTFFHQFPTAVLGLVYLYGRHRYIKGYIEDADKRIPGFWISINAQKGLVALCIVGMINTALKGYVGIHVIPWILAKYYGTEQTEDWWEF